MVFGHCLVCVNRVIDSETGDEKSKGKSRQNGGEEEDGVGVVFDHDEGVYDRVEQELPLLHVEGHQGIDGA